MLSFKGGGMLQHYWNTPTFCPNNCSPATWDYKYDFACLLLSFLLFRCCCFILPWLGTSLGNILCCPIFLKFGHIMYLMLKCLYWSTMVPTLVKNSFFSIKIHLSPHCLHDTLLCVLIYQKQPSSEKSVWLCDEMKGGGQQIGWTDSMEKTINKSEI